MNALLNKFSNEHLTWFAKLGIGYYPVKENPYDAAYFEKYNAVKETPIGLALNKARIDLVNQFCNGEVLDVGVGNGAFVEGRENTKGYDINPSAVDYLVSIGKYSNPMRNFDAMTFWDSLEHIHEPSQLLKFAKTFVFVSCPIYNDVNHVLSSKHFRPDEHCWYWTGAGLIYFMAQFGFEVQLVNWMETDIGREDIGTFVFKRIS